MKKSSAKTYVDGLRRQLNSLGDVYVGFKRSVRTQTLLAATMPPRRRRAQVNEKDTSGEAKRLPGSAFSFCSGNISFCSFYSLFYLGAVFCPGWGGFPTHVGRFSALYEKETPHCSSRNSAGFCFSFGGIPLKWPARIGADRGDSAPDPRVRLPGSRCSSLRPPARARYRPRSPAALDPAPHRPGCR